MNRSSLKELTMMNKNAVKLIVWLLVLLSLLGCAVPSTSVSSVRAPSDIESPIQGTVDYLSAEPNSNSEEPEASDASSFPTSSETMVDEEPAHSRERPASAWISDIPEYDGTPYVEVNDGVPFLDGNIEAASFEYYSSLDELGRCGPAIACIGKDLMPTEERGPIGMIRPSGWHLVKYDGIDGNYLFNRCHLIGYQLTAENANPQNLITGTRYMNTQGMLPFENQTASYIRATGNHVFYRVTPIFSEDNLLADGVLMEAISMEDGGTGLCFNVFVYNVQPGIVIDYKTGDSYQEAVLTSEEPISSEPEQTPDPGVIIPDGVTYVLNTNTMRFHNVDCPSVQEMKEKNRQFYYGDRENLLSEGYQPCGNCKP